MSQIHPRIILYDGDCPLCNATVRYILKHDKEGLYHFAPLKGQFSQKLLLDKFSDGAVPDSVILYDHGEFYTLSSAVIRIMKSVAGWWRSFVWIQYIPVRIRDFFYRVVASLRRKLWRKNQHCLIPGPELRERFHY